MCGSCGAEYRDVTDAVTHATKMHLAGRMEKILNHRKQGKNGRVGRSTPQKHNERPTHS